MAMNFLSLRSSSKSTKTGTRRLAGESLEGRSLLAADALAASAQYGDANLDGVFNSADLVQVFQAGKYETSEAADWTTGDWNLDGLFNSLDLVKAFQGGAYSSGVPATAISVPLKGVLEAAETSVVQFPTLFVHGSGSGNATHLGRFTVSYEFEVYIPTLTSSDQPAHFIAANGDSLFTVVNGQASPTEDPDVVSIVETYTIVGGSGHFDGASGEFTMWRSKNRVTGATSGSFDGTIVIPRGQ